RDRLFSRTEYGWYSSFREACKPDATSLFGNIEFAYGTAKARRHLLIAALAVQSYRLEQGNLPSTLGDLVPEYLPTIPQDPFTSLPLIYHVEQVTYLLYSAGPNQKDDGGVPYDYFSDDPSGDILLNTDEGNRDD
ncbi:MAG: hypothetical protein IH991_16045, partial [Planctomycetes bacterium]|nr:hypothetical protein [Planctomycetota bacterium]